MKSEWKKIELSEVITDIAAGPFGSNLKVSSFVPYGFPIIDGANLKGFKVTDNVTKFVTEEKARSLSRSIAKRGDVVVTISGTLGQIAYIPQDSKFPEYLCSQRQFRISFDENRVYVPYLVFYFHTYEGQNKILSFANQTGVPALSQPLKNFKKIVVSLPSLDQQKKIAGTIECLNDKIELNNKINDNLEQQARVALNHWIEEHSKEYEMLPLSDVVTVNDNTYSPKEQWPFVNYLDTSSITDGTIAEIQHIVPSVDKLPSRARRKIIANDVVFSTVRPNQHHFGIIKNPVPNMLASTGFAVIQSKIKEICNELIYLRLTENSFIEAMQQLAEQSTSTFPSIKPSDLYQCEIPYPVDDRLTEILESIFSIIATNQKENTTLSQLRDTLLPNLMSGEIDVTSTEVS